MQNRTQTNYLRKTNILKYIIKRLLFCLLSNDPLNIAPTVFKQVHQGPVVRKVDSAIHRLVI